MAIRLARTPPAAPVGLAAPVALASAHRQGLRILLAEDNCIAAELLALMGHRLGMRIDRVENGLEAIETIHRAKASGTPYALLLMDAMMPVLSGVEAARSLRASGITAAELPIVAVTAATAPEELRGFHEAGMQACLAKPVALADLSACIDSWVPVRSDMGAPTHPYRMAALQQRYDLRRAEMFTMLEAAIGAGSCSPAAAAELRNHLHKLAGTAGSFGEDNLSKAAAEGAALVAAASPETLDAALGAALRLLKAAG